MINGKKKERKKERKKDRMKERKKERKKEREREKKKFILRFIINRSTEIKDCSQDKLYHWIEHDHIFIL